MTTRHNLTGGVFKKTTARKMIDMYVWYIRNTISYRQLGNLFGVTKSTAWKCINRVVAWLISVAHEFIKWPTGPALEKTYQKLLLLKKIPGIMDAIDCTHIKINAPSKNKEGYFDRKQNYSIVVQAVVDADKKFIDIYCREPGSLHDSRVLRRSSLYRRAELNLNYMFPNGTFLLADSAYPCKNWLPSFKDYGNFTHEQKKFNQLHSSARIVVENTFADFKNSFRRFMENKDVHAVTNLVSSACVVHNICIIKEDLLESEETNAIQREPHHMQELALHSAEEEQKRNTLLAYLRQKNLL